MKFEDYLCVNYVPIAFGIRDRLLSELCPDSYRNTGFKDCRIYSYHPSIL
ncbi:MAG: hypothetical protein ABI374_10465 [Ginsengibacter sp.]